MLERFPGRVENSRNAYWYNCVSEMDYKMSYLVTIPENSLLLYGLAGKHLYTHVNESCNKMGTPPKFPQIPGIYQTQLEGKIDSSHFNP